MKMSHLHYYDYIGFVGTIILVTTYILTQIRVLSSSDWQYPLSNLCGALLIAFSLLFDFNAASIAIELFWCGISVYGLIKCRAEGMQMRSMKVSRSIASDYLEKLSSEPPSQPSHRHSRAG
jgi:paired small multidrug resistance pump